MDDYSETFETMVSSRDVFGPVFNAEPKMFEKVTEGTEQL